MTKTLSLLLPVSILLLTLNQRISGSYDVSDGIVMLTQVLLAMFLGVIGFMTVFKDHTIKHNAVLWLVLGFYDLGMAIIFTIPRVVAGGLA